MPPIDMAVLQQKAFQQFDLIMDAEMDIQRQILTRDQIPFGKDSETPKAQKRFQYSNINPKKLLNTNMQSLHQSVMEKSIMSSVNPSIMVDCSHSQNTSTMQNQNRTASDFKNHSVAELSNLHSKQVQ